ncbi:hypothetical protein T440DRAFT_88788 [Plenodomus tracheiphilus IPT5]|uniref:Uncharacterized protein n=1 Tax=Plenodomus tracheiphilus IPT5 TaxID=1408161 RepID=A0A6A7B4J9_9PLEO|nr:hypothetical protein T440DRAFT_88788 [Plenodomus tracheiphilus IPT5]
MSRAAPLLPATITHAGRVTSASQASPRSCVSHVAAARPPAPGADTDTALRSRRSSGQSIPCLQLRRAASPCWACANRWPATILYPSTEHRCRACRSTEPETAPTALSPLLRLPNWARHLTPLHGEC